MRSTALSLVIGVAVLASACGGQSPAAPSTGASAARPTPAPAPGAATSGATISGTVIGVSSASRLRTMGTGLSVSVTGTSATAPVDDSGHFVLQNVPTGHVELHFMGAGVDATLPLDGVTENATIVISVRVSGSTAEVDNEAQEDANHNAEVEGIVTANNGSTLTVAGKTIAVSSTTTIVHGDTPIAVAAIHVGDRVHAQGTMTGTTLAATRIEVQDGAQTPGTGDNHGGTGDDNHTGTGGGDNHGAQVELSGTVSGRSSGCPVTFTVASTKVTTSSSTRFENTTCATLANGDKVQVQGTKQTDGSVSATQVEKKSK